MWNASFSAIWHLIPSTVWFSFSACGRASTGTCGIGTTSGPFGPGGRRRDECDRAAAATARKRIAASLDAHGISACAYVSNQLHSPAMEAALKAIAEPNRRRILTLVRARS